MLPLPESADIIDAWYCGKHHDFGANVQAIIRPDGLPIWTSDALPGHLHDLTGAQQQGVTAALTWSAAELDRPGLADAGYDGAGHGIKTPVKQPADGRPLALANRSVNRLLRGLRWHGERGFAILDRRWKTLRHTTAGPRRIGDIVAAALHLTHFEYRYHRQVAEITQWNFQTSERPNCRTSAVREFGSLLLCRCGNNRFSKFRSYRLQQGKEGRRRGRSAEGEGIV
jgi:hypothetical protein